MEKKPVFFQNIEIIYRRTNPLVKIVVIVAIVFSMLAVTTMGWVRSGILSRTGELRTEAGLLEQENSNLEDKIDALGSVQSVKQIAEEELDLVDPGSVVVEVE